MRILVICVLLFTGLISGTTTENAITSKKGVLTGDFKSLKGVMHEYSCYGYNVGQLTLSNGKVVAVCFTDESIEVECTRIRVKGKYVTKTIDSNGSSPCPAGTLTYFEANSYTCK